MEMSSLSQLHPESTDTLMARQRDTVSVQIQRRVTREGVEHGRETQQKLPILTTSGPLKHKDPAPDTSCCCPRSMIVDPPGLLWHHKVPDCDRSRNLTKPSYVGCCVAGSVESDKSD